MLNYAWGASSANKASSLDFQDEGGEPGPSDPLGFNTAFTNQGTRRRVPEVPEAPLT